MLVIGFGPFLDVTDNPARRVALALDGWEGPRGLRVVGAEMPVSYARAPAVTLGLAEATGAVAVVGVGVARGRTQVCVERRATRALVPSLTDVDGVALDALDLEGPAELWSDAPVEQVAASLGGLVSEDAGGYVCNAWLYSVTLASAAARRPVLFLHLPDEGVAIERVQAALTAWWSGHLSNA